MGIYARLALGGNETGAGRLSNEPRPKTRKLHTVRSTVLVRWEHIEQSDSSVDLYQVFKELKLVLKRGFRLVDRLFERKAKKVNSRHPQQGRSVQLPLSIEHQRSAPTNLSNLMIAYSLLSRSYRTLLLLLLKWDVCARIGQHLSLWRGPRSVRSALPRSFTASLEERNSPVAPAVFARKISSRTFPSSPHNSPTSPRNSVKEMTDLAKSRQSPDNAALALSSDSHSESEGSTAADAENDRSPINMTSEKSGGVGGDSVVTGSRDDKAILVDAETATATPAGPVEPPNPPHWKA